MLWLSLYTTFMYDHYSLIIIDYSLLKLFYMSIQYVIQGHMHRLYYNTVHKTQTLNPQMYLQNSGTQGFTADTLPVHQSEK